MAAQTTDAAPRHANGCADELGGGRQPLVGNEGANLGASLASHTPRRDDTLPTLRLSPLQSSINDGADFKAVADAMKVIGFTADEVQTVYKILATILHLVTKRRIRPFLLHVS